VWAGSLHSHYNSQDAHCKKSYSKKIVQNLVRKLLKTKLFVIFGDFGKLPASAWRGAYQNLEFSPSKITRGTNNRHPAAPHGKTPPCAYSNRARTQQKGCRFFERSSAENFSDHGDRALLA
jgi:hypothetical protein